MVSDLYFSETILEFYSIFLAIALNSELFIFLYIQYKIYKKQLHIDRIS